MGGPHHKLVVDVTWDIAGQLDLIHLCFTDEDAVPICVAPSRFAPRRQQAELHSKNRSLQRIQTKVAAYDLVIVLGTAPVDTQQSEQISTFLVMGDNHSSVSEGPKIFAREKREAAGQTHRSGLPSVAV